MKDNYKLARDNHTVILRCNDKDPDEFLVWSESCIHRVIYSGNLDALGRMEGLDILRDLSWISIYYFGHCMT